MHVGTSIEKCREINQRLLERDGGKSGYEKEIFENLVYRYEEPNGMNRWDSPLFTVLFEDPAPPYEQIWSAIVGSDRETKTVKPNAATVTVSVLPTLLGLIYAEYLIGSAIGRRLPI